MRRLRPGCHTMETFMQLNRFRLEAEEFQERTQNHDQRRRLAHNALIDQLHIVNRNLFSDENLQGEVPIGGIFSLNPDSIKERTMVAHWQDTS